MLEDNCLWEYTCSSDINIRILKNMYTSAARVRNSRMKSYNGNGRSCVTVMHWNLGPRRWDNKTDNVQLLVDQHKPDILYVSEVNLYNEIPDHMCNIKGYIMTKAKTTVGLGYSRIVLLCKAGLQYTVELDRMEGDISSIWIKLGGRVRRGVRVWGVYREHTLVRQQEPNDFGESHQQEYRWKKFVKQWVTAICKYLPTTTCG